MYSPSNGVANLLSSIPNSHNTLATSSTISVSNGMIISNNGLVTATSGGGPFNTFGNGTGNTNSNIGVVPPQPKRPRNDDFLSSPSPGAISVSAPPLTPSPGPPSQAYTVISNGYSSPMSSGSYDPYSPNGKIGKFSFNNINVTTCLLSWYPMFFSKMQSATTTLLVRVILERYRMSF